MSLHRRFLTEFDADRLAKLQVIRTIESDLMEPLSQTPYVLILSVPGINVVSAAEFAGEMGPIKDEREEAESLAEEMAQVRNKRGSGPKAIGEILPAVLVKLGIKLISSSELGEADLT